MEQLGPVWWVIGGIAMVIGFVITRTAALNSSDDQIKLAGFLTALFANETDESFHSKWDKFIDEFEQVHAECSSGERQTYLTHILSVVRNSLPSPI